ncbi:hypothetical protein AR687_12350 [Flavobacteriaceae bacterium CRH]|nr:hypothetical protein AR687_12350 [Flavobacteriaceae bacterium CRH]
MEKQTVKLTEKFGRLSKEELKGIKGGNIGTVCGPRPVPTSICASGRGIAANSGDQDPSQFQGIVEGFCNVIIVCMP